ncbi:MULTISPECIES: DUF3221 domain-containing protein [unclassified Planococcus (in: firmicutes)]|uniref:DUF3221 domain-containing protein n=1 Tax=unclassified Planococcus (in: firmicutes) TaxID=2662419 RepID=UPI000C330897|nr:MULTISPECIES: DUF3221 domain-containing protein [unclassified Planococcus (in: firmicutes)]AUD13872.1 hypothetical protein CW734_09770 [Planococcus sp. MB-3u-03]PKG45619.1 hypothetical protein CXF66_10340 [Planococcus sp. Urea-trap-24]PKG88672.1 hypothetical protein CXF91_11880 [Planococcus sp. Urea-3u-39]PKH38610.1 hypothetical protein CXF77_10935 [Planococcus sp. MB-3u-09]
MKKASLFLAGFLLLAGCSDDAAPTEPAEPAGNEEEPEIAVEQEGMTEEGFITQIGDGRILIGNIYFSVPEDVEVQFAEGGETSEAVISDLRTGMKVTTDYTGPLEESFPMQGEAEKITILQDEESQRQSEALQAFINEEQLSKLILMGQPLVRGDEIGFLFNDMETGDLMEVRIDMNTLEYTMGNEEEEEQAEDTEE